MRRFVSRGLLFVLALAAVPALPSFAYQAGHGAIAYDGEGAYGSSNDYASADAAKTSALEQCQKYSKGRRCAVVASFKSQCAAIADTREGDGYLGWAVKAKLTDALDAALASCNAKAGNYHCGVIAWTCPSP
jgi:hypothetical protein